MMTNIIFIFYMVKIMQKKQDPPYKEGLICIKGCINNYYAL